MNAGIKTNSAKAWFLACRPKTLTGAAAPVLVAIALAWHDMKGEILWTPALLCLLFALLMQIDANLVNDYFDGIRGKDTAERLGPERAIAQGWITPRAMRIGLIVCTLLAAAAGLPLIAYGGRLMLLIGLACMVFCLLYTTHLASLGMGDILVLLFFGIVPVCITYYILTKCVSGSAFVFSIAMGLVTDLLLTVNNYRDRELDAKVGKKTLVVFIGESLSETLYLLLGLVAFFISYAIFHVENKWWKIFILIPFLILHIRNYTRLRDINHGKELNQVLGTTAAGIFLFAVLLSVSIII